MTNSLDRVADLLSQIEQLHQECGFDGDPGLYFLKARLATGRVDKREAYRNYAYAIEHFKDVDASAVSATYLEYARLLRHDGHVDSAINVLEYGVSNNRMSHMMIHTPELIRELVLCYREAGNHSKALDYSLSYQEYQDSIFKISRERALQENRIRHEVFTNERMIDEQRATLATTRLRMTLLAVTIAAVLLLLCLTYINYRKKDRLYRAIVLQNREYMSREQKLTE
ncbi:MAG: hypothetical protein NC411_10900 [Bacteroides sp.]|nr:hypothetical protein [Bacteroides sp.]